MVKEILQEAEAKVTVSDQTVQLDLHGINGPRLLRIVCFLTSRLNRQKDPP